MTQSNIKLYFCQFSPKRFSSRRFFRSKKVSSKFGVYELRVPSEFQLVIACLLCLNMTSQLSMVKSLYLYSSQYGGWSCDLEFCWKLKICKLQIWNSLFLTVSLRFYYDPFKIYRCMKYQIKKIQKLNKQEIKTKK